MSAHYLWAAKAESLFCITRISEIVRAHSYAFYIRARSKSALQADAIANRKQMVTVTAHPEASLEAHSSRSNGHLRLGLVLSSRTSHSRHKSMSHL